MAQKNVSFQSLASKKALQILIAILFISMGIVGFSTGKGWGHEIANEVSKLLGKGDQEVLVYIISTVQLLCGIVLLATMFVSTIPANFTKIAMMAVWIIWLVIIVLTDILRVDFGNLDGSEWFVWIQQIVLHLIVFAGILQIQEK